MFDQKLEKYFKPFTQEILFVELSGSGKQDIGVPVPVDKEILEAHAAGGELLSDHMIEGMVRIVASDENFRYNGEYLTYLKNYSDKMVFHIIAKGLCLAEEGRLLEGALHLRAALMMEPTLLDVLYNYGRICHAIYSDKSRDQEFKADFKEVALELFELCTENYPDFALAYYYLGYFYFNSGLYEKARLIWEKYMNLSGLEEDAEREDIEARLLQLTDLVAFEKGYLAVMAGKADEGLAILEPLMEKDPASWNIMYFTALAYRKKGDLEKAVSIFKEVLKISPSQADAMNELGLCFAQMEDQESAEKYFKKALIVRGEDPEILGNLAGLYIGFGRFLEAEDCLNRAISSAPDDEILKGWRRELEKHKK